MRKSLISNFFRKKRVGTDYKEAARGAKSNSGLLADTASTNRTESSHPKAPTAIDLVVILDDDESLEEEEGALHEAGEETPASLPSTARKPHEPDAEAVHEESGAPIHEEANPLETNAVEEAEPSQDDQEKVPEANSHAFTLRRAASEVNPFVKFLCPAPAADPPLAARKRRNATAPEEEGDKAVARRRRPTQAVATKRPRRGGDDFVRMRDLPPDEQERIVRKWHGLADPVAPLEVRRFQVLVAARLHAQCREATVRTSMERLRGVVDLTAHGVSRASEIELVPALSSLQYHTVKASHLIQASRVILEQFRGEVPEREEELRRLPGIGPVFADLLAFVNTRESHLRRNSQELVRNG